MKIEKQNVGVIIGITIRSFFIAIALFIAELWSFLINNIGRIIKIIVITWLLLLLSILTLALSYWLLGLGSKYFVETGKELETLDMEKISQKYPELNISLEGMVEN